MVSHVVETRDIDARALLAEQAVQLERRCEELATELKACEDKRGRVLAALRALDGTTASRRTAAVRRAGTLETDELVALMHAMLQPAASMSVEELRTKIEDEVRSTGRSLVGLRARLRKALRDERFVATENGEETFVRLRAGTGSPQ